MDVVDDILRLILERIDSPVSLVRAASTCKRWCRIIAAPGFLCRFHSVHAPNMAAGDYFNDSTLLSSLFPPMTEAVAPPRTKDRRLLAPASPSIDAGQTMDRPSFVPASPWIDARRFSLDFLPNDVRFPHAWTVLDSRGSLLLMSRARLGQSAYGFPDMFVCEPATRRYKKIPPPPKFPGVWLPDDWYMAAYLVDGDTDMAGGRVGMSSFKVLCVFRGVFSAHTAMFTAGGTGSSWSREAPTLILHSATDHVDTPEHILDLIDILHPFMSKRDLGRAGGSWYFQVDDLELDQPNQLIVLDSSTGEFSVSELSISSETWVNFDPGDTNFYVADGRDGKPRMVTVFDETMKVFTRLDEGAWALEKSIVLSEAARGVPGYKPSFFDKPLNILTRAPGFVILSPRAIEKWLISVDLDTMEVALAAEDMGLMVYRCELPWPPAINAE